MTPIDVIQQAAAMVAPLANNVILLGVALGITLVIVFFRHDAWDRKDAQRMNDEYEKPKRLSDDEGETFILGDDGELIPAKHKNR